MLFLNIEHEEVASNATVSSNFVSADFRKMRTDSFQKSRIIPTIPQSDADCDEVGRQQEYGASGAGPRNLPKVPNIVSKKIIKYF